MTLEKTQDFPWEAEIEYDSLVKFLRTSQASHNQVAGRTHLYYVIRRPDGAIILIAGVVIWSFPRKPELWIMITKRFMENFRESLRLTKEYLKEPAKDFPGLICEVHKDDLRAIHFAEFFGWKRTGEKSLRPNGEDYINYGL